MLGTPLPMIDPESNTMLDIELLVEVCKIFETFSLTIIVSGFF